LKDLVRLRKQRDKYLIMQSQMKSIALQVDTLQAQIEINEALKGATSTMTKVNESMDIREVQSVMKQFMKNAEEIGVKMELVRCLVIIDTRCY